MDELNKRPDSAAEGNLAASGARRPCIVHAIARREEEGVFLALQALHLGGCEGHSRPDNLEMEHNSIGLSGLKPSHMFWVREQCLHARLFLQSVAVQFSEAWCSSAAQYNAEQCNVVHCNATRWKYCSTGHHSTVQCSVAHEGTESLKACTQSQRTTNLAEESSPIGTLSSERCVLQYMPRGSNTSRLMASLNSLMPC